MDVIEYWLCTSPCNIENSQVGEVRGEFVIGVLRIKPPPPLLLHILLERIQKTFFVVMRRQIKTISFAGEEFLVELLVIIRKLTLHTTVPRRRFSKKPFFTLPQKKISALQMRIFLTGQSSFFIISNHSIV
ncbi:hypothetical protein KIN20_038394 [Parelaphostrongylus tenuis]|uniref:Uncharacterized protein n=1 Tax=Parelaphostrongylus tenuis TaxID=148309 RepID=A0AAD5M515_PARTN|nr:hypothetical protein KIN20_038394 [Parelaphostrongylus tenuis]